MIPVYSAQESSSTLNEDSEGTFVDVLASETVDAGVLSIDSGSDVIETLNEPSSARAFDQNAWRDVPLHEIHARELHNSAISPEVARELGFRTLTKAEELPEGAQWLADQPEIFPAWLRPLREVDGTETFQIKVRPGSLIDKTSGESRKYISPQGRGVRFALVRGSTASDAPVLIVEGNKQSAAVYAWADERYTVMMIAGIEAWSRDGVPAAGLQKLVENRPVVIFPDADAAVNAQVYAGAARLGEACSFARAKSVKFASLAVAGATGKTGADDFLAAHESSERRGLIDRLIEMALDKPAKTKPAKSAKATFQLDPTREFVDVDSDRGPLTERLFTLLLDRFGGTELFRGPEGFTTLRQRVGDVPALVPCGAAEMDAFLFRAAQLGTSGKNDGAVTFKTLDRPTLAVLQGMVDKVVGGRTFPQLEGVSALPVVREDGSVATRSGYDAATRQFIWLPPQLEGLSVPEHPTPEQVAWAKEMLLSPLADFEFRCEADRVHALALFLTMFVRPSLPTSPLFALDGLMPSVGKGLLLDVAHILATGQPAPVSKAPSSEDERRKSITASLVEGRTFLVLDEVHEIDSDVWNAVITAQHWSDRRLGSSSTISVPNRAVITAAGNNIEINADSARRVLRIRLVSHDGKPELRNDFQIPDLRRWVSENRGQLVQAALVLIRAWFSNGCGPAPEPFQFASFEQWQDVIGGVLHEAGVEGFLSTTLDDRLEKDADGQEWSIFKSWVHQTFGDSSFSASELHRRISDDENAPTPPNVDRARISTVSLGRLLKTMGSRFHDGMRFDECGRKNNTLVYQLEMVDRPLRQKLKPEQLSPDSSSLPTDISPAPGMTDGSIASFAVSELAGD